MSPYSHDKKAFKTFINYLDLLLKDLEPNHVVGNKSSFDAFLYKVFERAPKYMSGAHNTASINSLYKHNNITFGFGKIVSDLAAIADGNQKTNFEKLLFEKIGLSTVDFSYTYYLDIKDQNKADEINNKWKQKAEENKKLGITDQISTTPTTVIKRFFDLKLKEMFPASHVVGDNESFTDHIFKAMNKKGALAHSVKLLLKRNDLTLGLLQAFITRAYKENEISSVVEQTGITLKAYSPGPNASIYYVFNSLKAEEVNKNWEAAKEKDTGKIFNKHALNYESDKDASLGVGLNATEVFKKFLELQVYKARPTFRLGSEDGLQDFLKTKIRGQLARALASFAEKGRLTSNLLHDMTFRIFNMPELKEESLELLSKNNIKPEASTVYCIVAHKNMPSNIYTKECGLKPSADNYYTSNTPITLEITDPVLAQKVLDTWQQKFEAMPKITTARQVPMDLKSIFAKAARKIETAPPCSLPFKRITLSDNPDSPFIITALDWDSLKR